MRIPRTNLSIKQSDSSKQLCTINDARVTIIVELKDDMSDAPDSDSSMPESTVPTLESRPPLLPSSVDNDYKCTTNTITESCVCYISNSTTAPANTRTCQTYFNIPLNLHSFIQVICWEAGVWFPALNNFCHSFLCSDVLFSATFVSSGHSGAFFSYLL